MSGIEYSPIRTTWRQHFNPPSVHTEVTELKFDDVSMSAHLSDGRIISVPLDWFPMLKTAPGDQLWAYEIIGGTWLRWEELDEDIDMVTLLRIF